MPDDGAVVRRNVSLYPEQDAAISTLDEARGLHNYSAALRIIVNEWLALQPAIHRISRIAPIASSEFVTSVAER